MLKHELHFQLNAVTVSRGFCAVIAIIVRRLWHFYLVLGFDRFSKLCPIATVFLTSPSHSTVAWLMDCKILNLWVPKHPSSCTQSSKYGAPSCMASHVSLDCSTKIYEKWVNKICLYDKIIICDVSGEMVQDLTNSTVI